jgi:hypothetical protein
VGGAPRWGIYSHCTSRSFCARSCSGFRAVDDGQYCAAIQSRHGSDALSCHAGCQSKGARRGEKIDTRSLRRSPVARNTRVERRTMTPRLGLLGVGISDFAAANPPRTATGAGEHSERRGSAWLLLLGCRPNTMNILFQLTLFHASHLLSSKGGAGSSSHQSFSPGLSLE